MGLDVGDLQGFVGFPGQRSPQPPGHGQSGQTQGARGQEFTANQGRHERLLSDAERLTSGSQAQDDLRGIAA